VLLSDRDIRAQIEAGRVKLEPWDPTLLQPSSVDLRLDRLFRTFVNHRYTHIDPATQQDDLTVAVEVEPDEPFVLHPGEFVLGSTFEVITLPDDIAGRLEGKALATSTPVPTPQGWRTMGDLAVGDQVFAEDGRPTRVLDATDVMSERPCYEIEFSDHSVVVADASHQWFTRTKSERKHGKPGAVRTTANIAASLRVGKEWNHHVPIAGALEYPRRELPVDPYVLGLWLGDGHTASAVLTTVDTEILGHVMAAGYPVWPRGRSTYRIGGTGQRRHPGTGRYGEDDSLQHTLRTVGLLGNKHVPDEYFIASPDQRLRLLQGLMDSDGYCDEVGRCEFVSTKEVLARAVVRLAAGLGQRPTLRKKRAMLNGVDCGPAYQVKFVPTIPVFRLTRKLERQSTGPSHRHRAVVAARPVPSVPVRCIQVANESGLFLVGDTCLVTHNSSLGRLGLLTHSTAGFIDPGFSGHVTLELSNVANLPIVLWPGMKVGQLCLFRLTSPAEHPYGSPVYGSRYQGQRGPTPSRSFQRFRKGLS
jgi:deoxycytidine triphosphate deaminase